MVAHKRVAPEQTGTPQTEQGAADAAQEDKPGNVLGLVSVGAGVVDDSDIDEPAGSNSGQASTGSGADEREPDKDEQGEGGQQDDAPYGRRLDGTPMKKRGRPPKDAAAQQEAERQRARLRSVSPGKGKPTREIAPVGAPVLASVNYQAMGEVAAGLWFNVPAMVLGEGWLPDEKAGEPQAVAGAFRDYFKAIQLKDLPPGFALCVVLGTYTLAHAQNPTVGDKFKGVGKWVRSKLKRG